MTGNVFGDLDRYKHHLVYCGSSELARVNLVTVQFLQTRDYLGTVWFSVLRSEVKPQNHFMRVRKKHLILLLVSHKWLWKLSQCLTVMSKKMATNSPSAPDNELFCDLVEVVVHSDPNIKYPWFEETYSASLLCIWTLFPVDILGALSLYCRLPHYRPPMNHLRMKSRFY